MSAGGWQLTGQKLGLHYFCLGTALLPLTGAGHHGRFGDTEHVDGVAMWMEWSGSDTGHQVGLSWNPSSITHKLFDLGQVTFPLQAPLPGL